MRIGPARPVLALALFAGAAAPAAAQWETALGAGMRHAVHAEYDMAGRRMVREDGWLPGITARAAYRAGSLTWCGGADWYRGGLAYQGRTQAGVPAASTTATALATLGLGVAWTPAADWSLLAALEADRWRRDIAGAAGAAGLQERYRSRRLFAGVARTWRPAPGRLDAQAGAIAGGPERLRVGFSGQFDPATLDTARARGVRLAATLRPAWAPSLALGARYDRLAVARSGDAPLTAGGQYRGSVAQPEHARQAITLTLSAIW